jgi:hypothetical protein
MKFVCQTLFDITATGVTGHFKSTRIPFVDRAGQTINDQDSWNHSRNQQRNWETLTQILSLRTQLADITPPIVDQDGKKWMFEFETEYDGVFGGDNDPTEVLRLDANGVPMLTEPSNSEIDSILITDGPRQNIWFMPNTINI